MDEAVTVRERSRQVRRAAYPDTLYLQTEACPALGRWVVVASAGHHMRGPWSPLGTVRLARSERDGRYYPVGCGFMGPFRRLLSFGDEREAKAYRDQVRSGGVELYAPDEVIINPDPEVLDGLTAPYDPKQYACAAERAQVAVASAVARRAEYRVAPYDNAFGTRTWRKYEIETKFGGRWEHVYRTTYYDRIGVRLQFDSEAEAEKAVREIKTGDGWWFITPVAVYGGITDG